MLMKVDRDLTRKLWWKL